MTHPCYKIPFWRRKKLKVDAEKGDKQTEVRRIKKKGPEETDVLKRTRDAG